MMAMITCLLMCSMTSTATVISPIIGDLIGKFTPLGYTATQVKQILSIPKLSTLVMTIFGVSFLIDRVDNKILGIIGSAGIGICGVLCAFVDSLNVILFLRFMQGVFMGMIAPFFAGYLGRLWDGDTFKRLVGLKQTAAGLFSAVGTFTIGILAASYFQNAFFWYAIDIVIAVLIAIFLPSMPAPTKEEREAAKRKTEEQKALTAARKGSVSDDERKRVMRTLYIMTFLYFLMNVVRFATYSQLTLCVTENGGSTMAAATAQTVRQVSAAVFAIFFKEVNKLFKKFSIPLSLLLTGVGMCIIGRASTTIMICVGAVVFGGFYGLVNPAFYNSVNNAKKVGGTANVKNAGFMVIATDLGGYLSAYIMDPLFAVLGITSTPGQMFFGGMIFSVASLIVLVGMLFLRTNKKAPA